MAHCLPRTPASSKCAIGPCQTAPCRRATSSALPLASAQRRGGRKGEAHLRFPSCSAGRRSSGAMASSSSCRSGPASRLAPMMAGTVTPLGRLHREARREIAAGSARATAPSMRSRAGASGRGLVENARVYLRARIYIRPPLTPVTPTGDSSLPPVSRGPQYIILSRMKNYATNLKPRINVE